MAYNGSGVHNRVHDWTTDLSNTVPVTASRMDAEHDDMSTALSLAICRDGQSTTTARIPFAAGTSAAAGTTSSVSYAQTNDANTGMYFPATDQWGLVAGGTATLTSTATKLTATVAVDFTGAVAPTSSDGAALGSATQMWSDLFLASGAVVNFNNGDVTMTHAANALNIAGGTVTFDTAPTPAASDGAALGTASVMWSDLFLASGSVINFNNGDVTITHSANALNISGGAVTFGSSIIVGSNTINGAVPTRQVLTSGSSATYTTPAGARQLRISMIGGGGGGGASATNGGANGVTTLFNAIEAAPGSGGGVGGGVGGTGGTGGAGSASFRIPGSDGATGSTATNDSGKSGGSGYFGGAGRGGVSGAAGQAAKTNSGSGGGGGGNGSSGNGAGGGSGEYVEIIINTPSATYTYTVGAGGAGGSAGGQAGGAGAAGIIIVDEYY